MAAQIIGSAGAGEGDQADSREANVSAAQRFRTE